MKTWVRFVNLFDLIYEFTYQIVVYYGQRGGTYKDLIVKIKCAFGNFENSGINKNGVFINNQCNYPVKPCFGLFFAI